MADIERVKSEFQRIKSLGYILSVKPFADRNDGALGNTFETILGVRENNLKDADFEGWECKSQRQHTKSAASLFTCKPDFPEKGDEYMRENWGINDEEYPHIKVFRTSIYAHRWSVVYGRYKMKIQIDDAEEKLLSLNGVAFDWIRTGKSTYGIIAQDVEEILPEAVSGIEGEKKVNYNCVVSLLIEAMKEQSERINELEDIIRNFDN